MRTVASHTVVVIGGGLSGALVARQLVRAGVDVLVLERGPAGLDGAESRLPSQRDELRWAVRGGLMQDGAMETYTFRPTRSEPARPMRRLQSFLPGTGAGGAGNHWNGQSHRWSAEQTQLRSHLRHHYGNSAIPEEMSLRDWGVSYEELEPYYDLFEKLFGVSGQAGNVRGRIIEGGNPFEAARQNEYPQPPLAETEAGAIFRTTARQLGLHPFPMPAANSSGAYTNPDGIALGACQFCGHCGRYACEANAKGTPMAVLYPWLQRQRNFELRPLAHVLSLVHEPASRQVRGVRYLDLVRGAEVFQPADAVVLAGFSFTNARLLLSAQLGVPYDPTTGRGVVGKNLCFQVNAGVGVFFRDRWINPFFSAGAAGALVDDFNDDHFDHTGLGFLGGGAIGVGMGSGTPILARAIPPGTPPWGTAWKKANADWYAHRFSVGVQGSCYPHRENFLDLDPDYTDAYGQPLLRITFEFQQNEQNLAAYCTAQAEKIARAMGATIVAPPAAFGRRYDTRLYQGTHVAGGTPMGADPEGSVVSSRLQHWDADNLFVVGSSVFGHNAGNNPSELIAALSLRLGDDLARYVRNPQRLS